MQPKKQHALISKNHKRTKPIAKICLFRSILPSQAHVFQGFGARGNGCRQEELQGTR